MITESKLPFTTGLSILTIFILFGLSMVFTDCGETIANTEVDSIVIPELLQRNTKIQLGKEWDQVQNFYADQQSAIRKNKDNPEAKLNLAMLFVKEARITGEHGHYYPAALEMVDQILLEADLSNDMKFRSLLTKAGVKLSLHEFAQAKKIGQEAIKLNPRNAQIYGVMVDCHVELGEYDQAVKMADKMISIKPDIRSYSRISYLREIHGDIDGAKSAMKMAIESGYPGTEETAWAMQTLGEMYQLYGEPEQAKKIYNTILESRKDYPFAVGALSSLEYEAGNYIESEKIANQAIDIIPEVGFYIQLAENYKKQGMDVELKKITGEIFEMLQDDVDHGHNMNLEYAQIHLELLDDSDTALKYAQLEYEKRPNNIDVNRLMAVIYKSKNDISKSKQHKSISQATNSMHPQLNQI